MEDIKIIKMNGREIANKLKNRPIVVLECMVDSNVYRNTKNGDIVYITSINDRGYCWSKTVRTNTWNNILYKYLTFSAYRIVTKKELEIGN